MRDEMRDRFLRACRWLSGRSWEFGRGIDIDQDGDIDGSGFMFRLEPPRWLRAWARRQLPPPTEEERRFMRADISDVLLQSLVTQNLFTGLMVPDGLLQPDVEWIE
jgi:hypothetical protein